MAKEDAHQDTPGEEPRRARTVIVAWRCGGRREEQSRGRVPSAFRSRNPFKKGRKEEGRREKATTTGPPFAICLLLPRQAVDCLVSLAVIVSCKGDDKSMMSSLAQGLLVAALLAASAPGSLASNGNATKGPMAVPQGHFRLEATLSDGKLAVALSGSSLSSTGPASPMTANALSPVATAAAAPGSGFKFAEGKKAAAQKARVEIKEIGIQVPSRKSFVNGSSYVESAPHGKVANRTAAWNAGVRTTTPAPTQGPAIISREVEKSASEKADIAIRQATKEAKRQAKAAAADAIKRITEIKAVSRMLWQHTGATGSTGPSARIGPSSATGSATGASWPGLKTTGPSGASDRPNSLFTKHSNAATGAANNQRRVRGPTGMSSPSTLKTTTTTTTTTPTTTASSTTRTTTTTSSAAAPLNLTQDEQNVVSRRADQRERVAKAMKEFVAAHSGMLKALRQRTLTPNTKEENKQGQGRPVDFNRNPRTNIFFGSGDDEAEWGPQSSATTAAIKLAQAEDHVVQQSLSKTDAAFIEGSANLDQHSAKSPHPTSSGKTQRQQQQQQEENGSHLGDHGNQTDNVTTASNSTLDDNSSGNTTADLDSLLPGADDDNHEERNSQGELRAGHLAHRNPSSKLRINTKKHTCAKHGITNCADPLEGASSKQDLARCKETPASTPGNPPQGCMGVHAFAWCCANSRKKQAPGYDIEEKEHTLPKFFRHREKGVQPTAGQRENAEKDDVVEVEERLKRAEADNARVEAENERLKAEQSRTTALWKKVTEKTAKLKQKMDEVLEEQRHRKSTTSTPDSMKLELPGQRFHLVSRGPSMQLPQDEDNNHTDEEIDDPLSPSASSASSLAGTNSDAGSDDSSSQEWPFDDKDARGESGLDRARPLAGFSQPPGMGCVLWAKSGECLEHRTTGIRHFAKN